MLWTICLLGILCGAPASAQSVPPEASPRFEVVSIKPDQASPYEGGVQALPGGRLIAQKITVRLLIQNAYGIKPFQLAGGPKWIESDGYDIEAKAAGNPSREEMVLMMRALLEDRFKLKYHRETRQLPVYDLVAAKTGIKLRSSENHCFARTNTAADHAPASPQCGRVVVQMSDRTAKMRGSDVPMVEFIRMLTNVLGRPVIDRTHFTSSFDVTMDFVIDDVLAGFPVPHDDAPAGVPSILTAIQEQLGLKLQPAKGPVGVFVIDTVDRPTEN